jgi:hypothetical protein
MKKNRSMRFAISRLAVLEAVLIQLVFFRSLFFWIFTLDDALVNSKLNAGRIISTQEIACERFVHILASLGDRKENASVERTKADLVNQVYACTSELAALRSFHVRANISNLQEYALGDSPLVSTLVMEAVSSASRPRSAQHCTAPVCIDLVAALDPSPYQYVALAVFPWSSYPKVDGLIFGSIGLTFSTLLLGLLLRALSRALIAVLHPSKFSSLFIVTDLLFAPELRLLRIALWIAGYLGAFTVQPGATGESFLFRCFRWLSELDPYHSLLRIFVVWIAAAVLILRSTWVHQSLSVHQRLDRLNEVNQTVAKTWIDSGLDKLSRLQPSIVVDILELIETEKLSESERTKIINVLLSFPQIDILYKERGTLRSDDMSQYAVFSKRTVKLLDKLGYRERADVWGILSCITLICLPFILW